MRRALIISDDEISSGVIKESLLGDFEVVVETDRDVGVAKYRQLRFDLTFIETETLLALTESEDRPIPSGLAFLKRYHPHAPIVVISDPSISRKTIDAVKNGASDYLFKPIQIDEVKFVASEIQRGDRKQAELELLRQDFWSDTASEIVVTKSQKMQEVYRKVQSVAPTDSTVLLTGETGVGKSLIARLIHEHSTRKGEPLVSVHCGALPDNLVESELFGHEKGSFTGAVKRKLGRFEIAHKGTIFLDEIGTVTSSTQIKLLQVLQDSVFQRVGGEADIKVDVRMISATNENLKVLSDQKLFRSDLFYRLNVFPMEIPSLKERVEDIESLVGVFLGRLNQKYAKSIEGLDSLALDGLCSYSWPGNIRELENVIERAFIIEASERIRAESLPLEIIGSAEPAAVFDISSDLQLAEARERAINDFERQYLKSLLEKKKGKINETAEAAGVGVRQIHKLMTKYGLSRDDFKTKS